MRVRVPPSRWRPVAQEAGAPARHAGGSGFESHRVDVPWRNWSARRSDTAKVPGSSPGGTIAAPWSSWQLAGLITRRSWVRVPPVPCAFLDQRPAWEGRRPPKPQAVGSNPAWSAATSSNGRTPRSERGRSRFESWGCNAAGLWYRDPCPVLETGDCWFDSSPGNMPRSSSGRRRRVLSAEIGGSKSHSGYRVRVAERQSSRPLTRRCEGSSPSPNALIGSSDGRAAA